MPPSRALPWLSRCNQIYLCSRAAAFILQLPVCASQDHKMGSEQMIDCFVCWSLVTKTPFLEIHIAPPCRFLVLGPKETNVRKCVFVLLSFDRTAVSPEQQMVVFLVVTGHKNTFFLEIHIAPPCWFLVLGPKETTVRKCALPKYFSSALFLTAVSFSKYFPTFSFSVFLLLH